MRKDSKFRRNLHVNSNIDIKDNGPKYLDIYEEKNATRMRSICTLIENSLNSKTSIDDVIKILLNPERPGYKFLKAYIVAFKRLDAGIKGREFKLDKGNNFGKVSFSKTTRSYLTD